MVKKIVLIVNQSKNYKLKVQKVELRKIKQEDLIKVRELRAEDLKQHQKAKLAYREAQLVARADKIKVQKIELRKIKQENLIKVRELRSEDRKQLQKAKLAYKKDQLAAREDKKKLKKKLRKRNIKKRRINLILFSKY